MSSLESTSSEVKEAPKAPPEQPKPPKYWIKYTIDGEVLTENVRGRLFEHPLRTVELSILPDFITMKHLEVMRRFFSLMNLVKKNSPDRTVPLTRREVLANGVDKRLYQDLQRAALLKEALVAMVRNKDKKMTGARACVFFTPQGRAYIRKYIEPSYAVTENT